jgi:Ca2+-binding RTX toxin-like protein
MTPRLTYAILSMDAYNRGYGKAVEGLSDTGSIGTATLRGDIIPSDSVSTGFYAQAYSLASGKTVIAYRGTSTENGTPKQDDITNGWPLGGGFIEAQATQAIKFYRTVVGETTGIANNLYSANIVTTGHSLGGGLAGFVATLYGKQAYVYDTMSYGRGAEQIRQEALNQAANGDPFGFKTGIYGQYSIRPLNGSRVDASEVVGQFLGYVNGPYGVPETEYTTGEEDLGALDRHSQALLVSLIYAEDNTAILGANWRVAAEPLWRAYFNEEVGNALPAAIGRTGAGYTASATLQSAIAYSAIKSGERPFGDTGIDAMFDDAGDLGKVLEPDNAATIVKDHADDIANVLVQYAGGLALSDVERSTDPKAKNGILKLATDQSTLAIDFGEALWSKIGSPEDIVGQQEILDAVLDQETPDSTIREEIAAGMKDAYDDEEFSDAKLTTIDRILLPTTDGQVSATLEKRDGTGKQTLFVSGSKDDTITGTSGNEIIYGGAGNDKINAGGGVDLLYGGAGDDEIDAGAGNDFLFGGTGADTLKGGGGNDRFFADLDDEDDIIDGGTGTDTIVYRFETPLLPNPGGGYGGYGGGYSRAPITIELTSTTNGAKASMADFGIRILGLPDGGFGNDALTSIEKATIEAGDEDDTLKIANDAKVTEGMIINLGGGDNVIDLSSQQKTVVVDLSNNLVQVSPRATARSIEVVGAKKVTGGSGNDRLTAGTDFGAVYWLEGGSGDDVINSLVGNDILLGGDGNDTLSGGANTDQLYGEDGNDILNGDDGDDSLGGGSGIDILHGGTGNDSLFGGDGDDFLYGDAGNDQIDGAAGLDMIWGGDGNDVIGSRVFYRVLNDGDVIHGGTGNDSIFTSGGGEAYGDEGNDSLSGNVNSEGSVLGTLLDGGSGNDSLFGGLGDRLIGGADADRFEVGPGAIIVDLSLDDIFVGFDGRPLRGGGLEFNGSYYDSRYNIRYQYSGADLVVSNGSRSFTIENFINGAAGIVLGGNSLNAASLADITKDSAVVGGKEVAAVSSAQGQFWFSGSDSLLDAIARFDCITNGNGQPGGGLSASILQPDPYGLLSHQVLLPSGLGADGLIQAMASFGAERNVDRIDGSRDMYNGRREYLDLHAMS